MTHKIRIIKKEFYSAKTNAKFATLFFIFKKDIANKTPGICLMP